MASWQAGKLVHLVICHGKTKRQASLEEFCGFVDVTKYLVEIACLEWRLLSMTPSLLAAVLIWLTHLILDNETWVCLCFVQITHVFTQSHRHLIWHITHHIQRAS